MFRARLFVVAAPRLAHLRDRRRSCHHWLGISCCCLTKKQERAAAASWPQRRVPDSGRRPCRSCATDQARFSVPAQRLG